MSERLRETAHSRSLSGYFRSASAGQLVPSCSIDLGPCFGPSTVGAAAQVGWSPGPWSGWELGPLHPVGSVEAGRTGTVQFRFVRGRWLRYGRSLAWTVTGG